MKEKFSFNGGLKTSLTIIHKLTDTNKPYLRIFYSFSFIFFSVIYLFNPAITQAEYDLPADMATQELQCYKALGRYAFEYYPFNRIYHKNFNYSYKFHDTGSPYYDLRPDQPPYNMTLTSQPTAMIYYSSVYDQNIDASQIPLIHWGDGTTTQVPYFEIDCSNYGTNAFGEIRYARVFPGFTTTHTYTCGTSINDHYTIDPNVNNYYLRVSGKEDDTWNGTDHNGAYIYGDGIIDFSSACRETPEPEVNRPPEVTAEDDFNAWTEDDIVIRGSVIDDNLPNPPAELEIGWSQVSGPGTVTFADAAQAETTVRFDKAGKYTLRLYASDSEFEDEDFVTVYVDWLKWKPLLDRVEDQYKIAQESGGYTLGYYQQVMNITCAASQSVRPVCEQMEKHYAGIEYGWGNDWVFKIFQDFIMKDEFTFSPYVIAEIDQTAAAIYPIMQQVCRMIGFNFACDQLQPQDVGTLYAGIGHFVEHLAPSFTKVTNEAFSEIQIPADNQAKSRKDWGALAALFKPAMDSISNEHHALFDNAVKPGFEEVGNSAQITQIATEIAKFSVPVAAKCLREASFIEALEAHPSNRITKQTAQKIYSIYDETPQARLGVFDRICHMYLGIEDEPL